MSIMQEEYKNTEERSVLDCLPEKQTGSQYLHTDRLKAVSLYMTYGNMTRVSKETGISQATLSEWKNKTEWWHEVFEAIRKEKNDEFDAMATRIIHLAGEQLEDRLVNGDHVVVKNGKKNNLMRKPVSARDLVIVQGTEYDKRQLSRLAPTSISNNASTESRLNHLAEQMISLVEQNKPVSTIERAETTENPAKQQE